MGYSARRGFTNGSMKMTGAQRQAEMQARIQQMQEQVNAAQEAVEAQEFTASVGGGVVEAKVNGKKEVLAVTIKPEAVDPEDVEMLQDLVVSAVNEALRQAGEAMDKSIEQATGGLNLGAFGLWGNSEGSRLPSEPPRRSLETPPKAAESMYFRQAHILPKMVSDS